MKQSDECILWEGQIAKSGYGVRYLRPRGQVYAHRAVMADIHGWNAVMGKVVMHTCDVRACVNPDHLRIGTIAENNQDMFAKGRNRCCLPKGEAHHSAKLTEDQVREIRARFNELGVALADEYGVTPTLISMIRRNKIWKGV